MPTMPHAAQNCDQSAREGGWQLAGSSSLPSLHPLQVALNSPRGFFSVPREETPQGAIVCECYYLALWEAEQEDAQLGPSLSTLEI